MIAMRKMGMRNSLNDLWAISKSIAIIVYILMITFLFTFHLDITKSVKGVILVIYFAMCLVLVYNYMQALKTFNVHKRILERGLAPGSFSNFKHEELCSLRKSLDKSRVRRFSYPITSIEYRFFHHNWEPVALKELLPNNLQPFKSETRIAALNKSNINSGNGYNEIPAVLHISERELDSVIQNVKSLNPEYTRILEDSSVLNQNSETGTMKGNLENEIAKEEGDIKHKLESTNHANKISCTIKCPRMETWTPAKDLDSFNEHDKSLNLNYTGNLKDSSVLNQNSETMTKKGNLEKEITKEDRDILDKLENTNHAKEISCTIKCPSMKTRIPAKDLKSFNEHDKSENLKYTENLEDSSVLNQNSETVIKKGNLENEIPKEGDIQHKLESTNHANKISCTLKCPFMKLWTTAKDLNSFNEHHKSLNLNYTGNMEDSSVLNRKSETVTKKGNLENEIVKDGDIQQNLESNSHSVEISCTKKCPRMKTWKPAKDLDSFNEHDKTLNLNYTEDLEDSSVLNQNSETVAKKGNLENKIAKEEGDIQHKLESTNHANEISCTMKCPRMKTCTPAKDLNSFNEHQKSLNFNYTGNMEDSSVLNRKSETVTKQESLENQISGEGCIQHKLERTKCMKGICCTLKSTPVLLQPQPRDTSSKELSKMVKICPVNNPTHCLWRSLLQYKGTYEQYKATYDASVSTAKKFIRKLYLVKVNKYVSFLIKIPLNKEEFNKVNHISSLYLDNLLLTLYKISPIRKSTKALVSSKKHVPKVPMRPYVWNVSITPHMREMSRKRYINCISMRESKIRKNKSTISGDTQKNSEFLTTPRSLLNVITESYITGNEMLISKFEEDDLMKFYSVVLNEDYY